MVLLPLAMALLLAASGGGHAGFTASQIAQNVRFWLTGNLADIVLLSVGKNNINFDNPADTLAQTNQILDNIDGWQSEKNP